MQINKRNKSFVAMYAIVAIVYILLFALIPFAKPAGSWLMFVFSLISIAGGCSITLYALGKDDSLMSKFYGYPVFKIGIYYMLLQLGASVLVYIIGAFVTVPYWVGLLLSLVMASAAGIGIIAADNAHDFVGRIDQETVQATKAVTLFQMDIDDLVDQCRDEMLQEQLKKLANKCRYADPVSSPATVALEVQIQAELKNLRENIASGNIQKASDLIESLLNLLCVRSRVCEISK